MELVLNFSFTRPESSFLSFNAGICTKRPSRPAFATTTPPPCPPLATRSSLLWGQPRRRLPGQLLRHCPLRRASGRARSSAALLRGRNSWPPLRLGGQRLPIRTGPPQCRSPAARRGLSPPWGQRLRQPSAASVSSSARRWAVPPADPSPPRSAGVVPGPPLRPGRRRPLGAARLLRYSEPFLPAGGGILLRRAHTPLLPPDDG